MKRAVILIALALPGCASVTNNITNSGAGHVFCYGTVDKPVTVDTSAQADGNTVPVMP